jgi:hypothetical protein
MKAAKHDQNLYRTGSLVDKTSPGIEDFSFRFGLVCSVLNRAGSCNARQFALKLVANVTYGYTSAGFSGRMPCAELVSAPKQRRSRIERKHGCSAKPLLRSIYSCRLIPSFKLHVRLSSAQSDKSKETRTGTHKLCMGTRTRSSFTFPGDRRLQLPAVPVAGNVSFPPILHPRRATVAGECI